MNKNKDSGAFIAKLGIVVGVILIVLSFGSYIFNSIPG